MAARPAPGILTWQVTAVAVAVTSGAPFRNIYLLRISRGNKLANIMTTYLAKNTLAAACGLLLAGCITHEETVVQDGERARVEFENDAAGRVFYEALSKLPDQRRSESTTEIDIPVLLEHKRHVITGANAKFNDAVAECDTNKDGKITELEARIFADHVRAGK